MRRFHNPSAFPWLLLTVFAWLSGASGASLSAATTAYDAAGNRSLATRDAVPLGYAANDLNQYSQVGGIPQSHNNRGDLASHRGWALAYDAVGHLVQATGPGSSPTVIHYLHDGGGRRVGRSQSGAGGWDTTWFLQLGVEVMEARNPATGATAHFIHEPGLDQPLCRVDATVGASGSVVHYFHQDALGSVVALTNPAGAVVESYRYTAWGRPNVYDSNGILQAAGTPAQSAYLFTGREYEVATGLAHHRARSYSPELGRWTGPDPIGEAGGVNLYAYVGNAPVNLWDLLGLRPPTTSFWPKYPNYDQTASDVWDSIGGWLDDIYGPNSNSCAARVSKGLNDGGEPITPTEGVQTNRNDDGKRYIISAQQLRQYLNKKWGKPDGVIKSQKDLEDFQKSLKPGESAIGVSDRHAGVIKDGYNDPYLPYGEADVWILPAAQ